MRSLGSWRTGFHEKAFLDLLRAAVKGQSNSRRLDGVVLRASTERPCRVKIGREKTEFLLISGPSELS